MYGVALANTGNSVFQNQWSYILENFAPDQVYLIGGKHVGLNKDRPFKDAQVITSAEDIKGETVLVSPYNARYIPGELNLVNFLHPKDCTYIFGPDNAHLSAVEMGDARPDHSVFIDSARGTELYSFVAAGITLWHRTSQYG